MKNGVAMAIEASLRRVMRVGLCACVAVVTADPLQGQATDLRAQMDKYVASNQKSIVGELVELLSIPNVAADRATLTVFGPKVALHSGHYGNWAPNPAMRLAQLLATFKDDNGRVLVDGFYDGIAPLTKEERAMLEAVPDNPDQLKAIFGIAASENPARSLQEGLQLPTFNIRGLSSGFVGAGARTIVPDRAVADIDIRLVKETPADRMLDKVRAHLVKQGYHIQRFRCRSSISTTTSMARTRMCVSATSSAAS